MRKSLFSLLLVVSLVLVSVTPAFAQDTPPIPDGGSSAFLPLLMNGNGEIVISAGEAEAAAAAAPSAPAFRPDLLVAPDTLIDGVVSQALKTAQGPVQLVVRFSSPAAAEQAAGAKGNGPSGKAQQENFVGWLKSVDPNAKVLATLDVVMNAVIVETDARNIDAIAQRTGVVRINEVQTYEMDLSETVPYIGAAAVQNAGTDGTGVRVAVLDSGIDYTHFNLGGAGTLAAYEAAYGTDISDPRNTTRDGLFPTAKVVDGYDFVGELWPSGDLAPDPDPIDLEGHGTHVADIIAGQSSDGTHKGVAPGAKLLAVKVCSAISTSCSGVALLQGMEFALDPNGDGNISDAVDVINMSLGQSYGQKEDDLSFASTNAVNAGVVVVVSAGNSADRPYILGSPSSTPEVISVAQTQVPSAVSYPLILNNPPAPLPTEIRNTATVEWAPVDGVAEGDMVLALAAPHLLCTPAPVGAFAGKIVLIQRGTCSVSWKVDNAADAGAVGVVVYNNASGDPPSFSFGGTYGDNNPFNPVSTLIITQSAGQAIKARLDAGQTVNATISDAAGFSVAGSMVASSSRGPSYSYQAIKPDIGAPGASVSAIAGTGTGVEAFGGTSGAAPMVSGAAALVLSKFPSATPQEVRARLMNTGETNIQTNPATQPGVLAPITRIGGGEVRVDKAVGANFIAWDQKSGVPSLSFGYQALSGDAQFKTNVRVRNLSGTARTLAISPGFRYADDAASGAVQVSAPPSIQVPANGTAQFQVTLSVKAGLLPEWTLDGGSLGGSGALLQSVEFDGYLTLSDGSGAINLPWQILPRKSAAVAARPSNQLNGKFSSLTLQNRGATTGNVDIYGLLGTSPRIQKPFLPGVGDNYAIVDLRAVGARYLVNLGGTVGDLVEFGITTWGARSHPAYPAEFDIYVDVDSDGIPEGVVYTAENGAFASSGQTLVFNQRLAPSGAPIGLAQAFFFADADLNSGNMRMYVPLGFFGGTKDSKVTYSVYAFDNYFTGNLTDAIENLVFTAGTPRLEPLVSGELPVGQSTTVTPVRVAGGATASPSQSGFLLLYRNQAPGFEADVVQVK